MRRVRCLEDAREGAVGGNAVGEFESFAQAVFTQLDESSLEFVVSHAAERGRKGDEDATTARWRRDASDELGRHCASNQLAQIPDEVTTRQNPQSPIPEYEGFILA